MPRAGEGKYICIYTESERERERCRMDVEKNAWRGRAPSWHFVSK